jgi:dTDP-4-amino-4,6-dideoxygalactose transaminase
MKIPFNKPFLTGEETNYIKEAVESGQLSGNGKFTKKCQQFFQERYGIHKALLTTSCTDALEMCALLIDCQPGDEIIVPSYTFVSSALAFVRQGAKIVFADSSPDHPNLDVCMFEKLITSQTKAIVVVHYAGMAVDMKRVMQIAKRYDLIVIEDSAQAIESYYIEKDSKKALGSIGHLATFSFHETKNIISGEGGLLAINDERFSERAEIIWEKGTNRASFFRGEVNKYGWVDIGSSFLPSEVTAAFLHAQLENLELIQQKRIQIWENYEQGLKTLEDQGLVKLPVVSTYATNNAHMFYMICDSEKQRSALIAHLKDSGIHAVFHYQSLHKSAYNKSQNENIPNLPNADRYSDCLLRLPFYFELSLAEQEFIIKTIKTFYT